jgi:hypothetical protein
MSQDLSGVSVMLQRLCAGNWSGRLWTVLFLAMYFREPIP